MVSPSSRAEGHILIPAYDVCQGCLTRYHAHPANWLHRLPDEVSSEEGALLEPLVVALAGIDRCGLTLGDPLVIAGAGPIGLVVCSLYTHCPC